jgi:leader peptidase (prepilin peptidase)/N-methyltransferase
MLDAFLWLSSPARELPMWAGAIVMLWCFGLGAVIGSFLNVVIYRVPHEELKVSEPKRSHCPSCNAMIAWYDNIPILSWIVLRAKCRHCQAHIDVRYPFVELLVGLLAVAISFHYGLGANGVLTFLFAVVLVAIAYIDLDTFWIPEEMLAVLAGLGVVGGLIELILGFPIGTVVSLPTVDPPTVMGTLADRGIGLVAGFGVLFALKVVADAFFRATGRIAKDEEAMGLGDPLLLGAIGLFQGWLALPAVVFLASAQGAVAGGILAIAGRLHQGGKVMEEDEDSIPANVVPFGPFLALGAIEVAFFGIDWVSGVYGSFSVVFQLLWQ